MNVTRTLTAAALATLLAGPVLAQDANRPSTGQTTDQQGETPATDDDAQDPAMQTPPTAPGDAATPAQSGAQQPATMPAGTMPSGTMPSGTMPATGTSGAQVTAMAPIPDTAENRARYGQPESNAGKRTMGEGPVAEARRAGRRR